jgi:transposase
VRGARVWARLLGLKGALVEDVYCGDEGEVVVAVRPRWRERDRCGVCRRRCPGFDLGEGRRRWRALDLGTTFAFVEADAPRVACRDHGVVVCAVPWARHRSRFTRAFEDQAAWLAVHCSKSAVAQLMRTSWRTVGGICERVAGEARRESDLLAGPLPASWERFRASPTRNSAEAGAREDLSPHVGGLPLDRIPSEADTHHSPSNTRRTSHCSRHGE